MNEKTFLVEKNQLNEIKLNLAITTNCLPGQKILIQDGYILCKENEIIINSSILQDFQMTISDICYTVEGKKIFTQEEKKKLFTILNDFFELTLCNENKKAAIFIPKFEKEREKITLEITDLFRKIGCSFKTLIEDELFHQYIEKNKSKTFNTEGKPIFDVDGKYYSNDFYFFSNYK